MPASFVDFLYKNVLPACFYGISRATEGDTSQLVGESVACLRAMRAARGDEFLTYLQNEFFVTAFPAFPRKEDLVQALAADDAGRTKQVLAAWATAAKSGR